MQSGVKWRGGAVFLADSSIAAMDREADSYVLMAELMLRRTQADQVEPAFKRFVRVANHSTG